MEKNSTILITGGTGSFGRKFAETLIKKNKFKKIIIFSRDEQKQHEMKHKFNNNKLRFFIGDVRDKSRLYRALDNVDYVIHAAALKIVPTDEFDRCFLR
jgi:UDP-N-acetylglucosamine 4,6-dehydratase